MARRAQRGVVWLGLLLAGAAGAASPDPDAADFARYPAAPFRGRFRSPVFAGDRNHYHYRTILREAAARGANFAGHFALTTFGCGAGCNYTLMLDGNTGRTTDFPLGGERYYELQLVYRRDSRLVKAYWSVDYLGSSTCHHADFVLRGTTFGRLKGDGRQVPCPA